uniref:Si:ch211-120k19.1 n=1 Tax=Sinocyclocheilus grahami TaxID=75366 RepID=A0A672TA59_SINGR
TRFATADLIQQSMMGKLDSIDWAQTAQVALVWSCFHANFNYHWLQGLEKMFPRGGIRRVSLKVFLDQLFAAPMTISAFYIGLSTLEGVNTSYWSTMQAVNFSLIPPVARTVFVGVALGWTVFLCHFKQQKSDFLTRLYSAAVALVWSCFHANFNYHWLQGLEKMFPRGGIRRVSLKVFLDQLFAAPMTISAFYIGENQRFFIILPLI